VVLHVQPHIVGDGRGGFFVFFALVWHVKGCDILLSLERQARDIMDSILTILHQSGRRAKNSTTCTVWSNPIEVYSWVTTILGHSLELMDEDSSDYCEDVYTLFWEGLRPCAVQDTFISHASTSKE